jgi:hypothetical protein
VHPEIGHDILKRLTECISDIGQVEMTARMEGKQMFMIVAPGKAPAKRPPMPGVPGPGPIAAVAVAVAPSAPAADAAPAPAPAPAPGPTIVRKP